LYELYSENENSGSKEKCLSLHLSKMQETGESNLDKTEEGKNKVLMTHGVLCIYCGQPVERYREWTEVCQDCEDKIMGVENAMRRVQ